MSVRDRAIWALASTIGDPSRNVTWEEVLDVLAAADLLRPEPAVLPEDGFAWDESASADDLIPTEKPTYNIDPATLATMEYITSTVFPEGPPAQFEDDDPTGETVRPAVTAEQVAAVVERVLLVDVAIRYGCLATIEDATARDRAMAERLVSEIVAGLGIEVRAGERR